MQPLDPPANDRPVATLTALEIALIWMTQLVVMSLVHAALSRGGFYLWYYGADALPDAFAVGSPQRQLALFRQGLWVTAVGTPLVVVTALALLRQVMGISPAGLGLTARHLGRNLLMGLLFTAI